MMKHNETVISREESRDLEICNSGLNQRQTILVILAIILLPIFSLLISSSIGKVRSLADTRFHQEIAWKELQGTFIIGQQDTFTISPVFKSTKFTSGYMTNAKDFILDENFHIHLLGKNERNVGGEHKNLFVLGVFYENKEPCLGVIYHKENSHKPVYCEPSISSDGSKIAFITQRDNKKYFYILSVDNSELLFKQEVYPSWSRISWAPDSQRVLYSMKDGELYIMDVRSMKTNKFAEGREGAWSPDGEKVAFIANDKRHIVICSSSGEFMSTLEALYPYRITWSPDGRYLAYFRPRGYDGHLKIEITTIDGSARALRLAEWDWAYDFGPCIIWAK